MSATARLRRFFRIAVFFGLSAGAFSGYAASDFAVQGNDKVPRRKIDAAIGFPDRPKELSPEDWEEWSGDAAKSIVDLYHERGYFDAAARVDAPDTASGGGKGPWARISVSEGPRYRFGTVEIVPANGSAPLSVPGDLKSRPERWFEKDLVFRDRRAVLNRYGNAGFLHCRVTDSLKIDAEAKTVNLKFSIDPGRAAMFDTLIVRDTRETDADGRGGGPGLTNLALVRSLLKLRKGDTLSLNQVERFERKLKSTRAFNRVRLKDSLLAQHGNQSALILTMEERIPGEMDVSGFYETQYGAGAAANWSHGNMLGDLHEGRSGAWVAQRKQNAFLGYSSPLLFGTSVRFDNDLTANWYQDGSLQSNAGLFRGDFNVTNSSKLSRALTYWSRYVAGAELTGESVKTDSTERTREFTLNLINSLYFSFLDDAVNPARGARWSFTWGNGGSLLTGGDIIPVSGRHNWLEVESGFYYPAWERVKLAFRLDGGRFFREGGINAERFFLGGPRSVRSFGWRRLCPEKDSSSGVCLIEGIQPMYFLSSFEVRYSPFSPSFISPEGGWKHLLGMQVVPFVDYGNVWDVRRNLRPEGRGRAYGLGLRYALLSIFNLRLDYAVDGWERKNSQWVLDLAQAF